MRARDDADRVANELEAVTEQLGALKQNATELQAKIGGLREQRDGLTKEADALRDALASVRARHSTLTQILNDRSYTAEAVQKLFAANERGGGQQFRAVGVLADYAEVEEGHEAAIEQFLRDELEFVVVETFDHARTGISMLRDEVGGRATFFVDSLRNLRLENEYEPIANFHREDGVISRMDKLVEFRNPLGAAAKQFLPRLRAAYLTDSAAAAEKLARENPQYAFVTPDGTCRSEEHTSELQSRLHLVCRLLLEKKKKKIYDRIWMRSWICKYSFIPRYTTYTPQTTLSFTTTRRRVARMMYRDYRVSSLTTPLSA